jgi:divalent metal cation (Fe/Co/Zn/Cd) transporter
MLPVLLNLCLAALKFLGGSLSGSVSVTADALNNLTDALTALLTMLGLKAASLLGGKKHENGHGRLEWIVAMVVSCAVVLVG